MELQDELTELFKKYPFIHFDQLGELSILVPLTGAQRIAEHFSKGIALYLFGDNTCQSDLERETFFLGKLSSDGQMDNSDSFPVLFKKLIRELRELKSQQQAVTAKDFLQAIIDRLYELKKETDWFKNNRLGYQNFVEELRIGNNIFVAKGEFIVRAAPDNARSLDLPNLLVLENKDLNNIEQHMISESSGEDCLAALAKIPVLPHEDGLNLEISEAIGSLIAPLMTYLAKDNRNLRGMFAAIYKAMQKRDDSLQDQSDAVFATIASNFQIQNDDNGSEDYGKWTASELEESIIIVFKQARVKEKSEHKPLTFKDTFQTVFAKYKREHPEYKQYQSQTESYQLFVLQTFLYLCAVWLRLNSKDSAGKLLQIYQDKNELKSLVSLLCTNEAAVTTILESHFRISWPKDYQKIISATYEIAIAHLSAPHFDELRVACVPELVNSKQYTVMGGRLYWSIEPIYEKGTINTVQEQSKISVDHFALFYDNCQSYFHRMNTRVLLSEMLHQNLDPEGETGLAEWAIKHNIDRLSEKNKSELLNVAINNKKHKFASFLIERCAGYYPIAFKSLLNSKPLNAELIEQFIKKDTGYLHALKGADLVENLYKANLSEFALD